MTAETNQDDAAASPGKSLKRLVRKVLQFAARKLPFLPARARTQLQVWRGVQFDAPATVFIGEDVYFDDMYPELISVGRQVIITEGAKILTHFVDGRCERKDWAPFRFYKAKVRIGNHVFIGTNAVIAKPVNIGNGAMIGANAVVTSDVPDNAVMVGAPARQVGTLSEVI
jgi:acetyltransferase-like isoleucine patch superfamily enzyme